MEGKEQQKFLKPMDQLLQNFVNKDIVI